MSLRSEQVAQSNEAPAGPAVKPAPGTERPRRLRPKLHFELIGCGLHGHELLGTDAAQVRPSDHLFARQGPDGFRWYRCLRCDAWVPLLPPERPAAAAPPERDRVQLPLRGRPLRDRYVLRFIAVERAVHVLVLGVLAAAIFAFATHRSLLHHDYTHILTELQGGLGGPVAASKLGVVSDLNRLFSLSKADLYLAGTALSAYTAVLAFEMVGLWLARRWAEYLTFIETGILVPIEVYELARGVSYLKLFTFTLNIAVLVYLLFAHRLFGLRGGAPAEKALHDDDTGWGPLERATPPAWAEAPLREEPEPTG